MTRAGWVALRWLLLCQLGFVVALGCRLVLVSARRPRRVATTGLGVVLILWWAAGAPISEPLVWITGPSMVLLAINALPRRQTA